MVGQEARLCTCYLVSRAVLWRRGRLGALSRAWVLDLRTHYGRLGAGNCSDTVKLRSEGLTHAAPEELALGRPVPGFQAQHGPLCALEHVLAPLWTLSGLVNYFQASFHPRWSAIQVLDAAVSKIGRCS